MLRVMLTQDGALNEDGLNSYIIENGIDEPNKDPFSDDYYFQTLLSVAVNSNEISDERKLELVTWLILHGADLKDENTVRKGNLIGNALQQNNIALADLLLHHHSSISYPNEENDPFLIKVALDSANEDIMLWVIKNAALTFTHLSKNDYEDTKKLIHDKFPDSEKVRLAMENIDENYNEHAKKMILNKFDEQGKITSLETAMVLAAKMSKKDRENSIFVIEQQDIEPITKCIINFLTQDTDEKKMKFQIIHFYLKHAIYGEFLIDKSSDPPLVSYLHCDSIPGMISFGMIVTNSFKSKILPHAKIEVCDSDLRLQKGLGCSYFSLDGALMLSTPDDRPYAPDVRDHIRKNATHSFDIDNFMYFKCNTLPPRFIRGSRFIEDENILGQNIKGLNTLIFKSSDKNTIINKKNETAEQSAQKELKDKLNMRAENNMKKFQSEVAILIKDKNVNSAEFFNLLDQYRIPGLMKFFERKLLKSDKKMKI